MFFKKKSALFNEAREEIKFGDKTIVLETGKIARQATGSVMATMGETKVLATVVGAKEAKEGQDFFPLMVVYQEKFAASGRIPGSFNRREGRPSTNETLVSRLIDRPIRPLFPEGFKNEIQIICTVYNYDGENNPDMVAMVAASACLSISGIPFMGPIAGARVGKVDGEFVLNPTNQQMENSDLDLVVAGTNEGVLMVESEAQVLTEEEMLKALEFGFQGFQPVIEGIKEFAKQAGKEAWEVEDKSAETEKAVSEILKSYGKDLEEALSLKKKEDRYGRIAEIKKSLSEKFEEDYKKVLSSVKMEDIEGALKEKAKAKGVLMNAFHNAEAKVMRTSLIKTKKRIDGRKLDEIRPIECEVGVLSRNHGSALFTRGETQALVSATLGVKQDEQLIDGLDGVHFDNFMLHYNFPAFSVGEIGRMGVPGRREIGHGMLAFRANNPVMPTHEEFPYTIRVVSDITESNGSSSMATTCGTSMALMNAGVPVKFAVAGIAMGLVKEDKDFVVLSDIMGDEDHLGDMDFKVAGTKDGITSLQMDIKITSITFEIMKQALSQAKDGRIHILKQMAKAIKAPAKELSEFAPQIKTVEIKSEKIREVIGQGGKVIKDIVEKSGAKVDLVEEGNKGIVTVSGSFDQIEIALNMISAIVKEPEVGEIYEGEIVALKPFGAFVKLTDNKDGFLHISEISNERVEDIEKVLKMKQVVKVKVIAVEDRGVKVSMKQV